MLMYLFHFLDLDVFYADVGDCLARSSVKGTGWLIDGNIWVD